MKIIKNCKKCAYKKWEVMDVIYSVGCYYLIVNFGNNYGFLDLETGMMQSTLYSTLEEMTKENIADMVVEAELHIIG